MDGTRARALLGVPLGASTTTVTRAFRGAVLVAHPDHGGDPAAFAALVAARDLLLAEAPVADPPARRADPFAAAAAAPAPPSVDLLDRPRRVPQPTGQRTVVGVDDGFEAVLAAALAA